MATSPVFQAGGIISGFDTNSIIDQLTKLRQAPLDALKKRQSAYSTKITAVGDIVSKLKALKTATQALSDDGALGVKATSTNTQFTATPSTSSTAGRYDIKVENLASAAQAHSDSFASTDTVTGGTLTLTIDGDPYAVTLHDGDTLDDVAAAINATDAPVTATVLNDGTNDYLSIVNDDTGYDIAGADPTSSLQISENYTGATGKAVNLTAHITNAENAKITLNGIPNIYRRDNTITDAVPGTTLTLTAANNTTESLVQSNDTTETAKNLQTFVDAYNDVMNLLKKNLATNANSSRDSSLAGDSTLSTLRINMAKVVSTEVGTLTNVRSLVDLGIKSDLDGSLSIDTTKLKSALSRDPTAVNQIFTTATSGVADQVATLVNAQTNVTDGLLTAKTKMLNVSVNNMDTAAARMQAQLDAYKLKLVMQFTSMEKVLAGLKASGNYLSGQSSGSSQ